MPQARDSAPIPGRLYNRAQAEITAISNDHDHDDERPCLHCQIVELIDNFYADNPVSAEAPDAVDTNEIVTAFAKTVAELTCGLDNANRQTMIEQLMREIMEYDSEFREQDAMGTPVSEARH